MFYLLIRIVRQLWKFIGEVFNQQLSLVTHWTLWTAVLISAVAYVSTIVVLSLLTCEPWEHSTSTCLTAGQVRVCSQQLMVNILIAQVSKSTTSSLSKSFLRPSWVTSTIWRHHLNLATTTLLTLSWQTMRIRDVTISQGQSQINWTSFN